MSSSSVVPTPAAVDLTDHVAQIGGRTLWQSAKNLLTTGDTTGNPQVTERAAEQEEKNNETQRAGEQQYSDFLYRTQPDEYRKANPTDYALRKAHDFMSDVAVAPSTRGRTESEKAVIEPAARAITETGLGAYGVPAGGQGVGRTAAPGTAGIAPPGLMDEDIAAVGGKTIAPAPEHPVVMVSPESFIKKVSNVGGHTFPDVVEKYRADIRSGKPIETLEIHHDENGNVIYANGRHRAQAAFQEKVPQVPVRIINRGGGQPPSPPEERYELSDEGPEQTPRQAIESQGLVYKGELVPGSKVHMFEHPDHPGKTAAMNESEGITPESVKAKMDSKLKDFEEGKKPKDFPLGSKEYHEQNYKTSVPVKVTWPDHPNEAPHMDEVKGLNKGHALARARLNWPGAKVEIVNPIKISEK